MSKNLWNYYQSEFESDALNPQVLVYSPWAGHRPFAYDYVRNVQPGLIVELGSYYGCSAFAFLQAIKDGALPTAFYAIDTWQGDDFTKTDYQEDIYGDYKAINDRCFSGVSSHMLRMTFDQALDSFADGSIDLLHIDGSHKYEDVRHDYLTWRGKVAPGGVIFFHDVGEDLLFGEPMGSHIFWEELKKEQPYTLEFPFSNGLGLLFTSRDAWLRIKELVDFGVYQRYVNLHDTINKDEIRKNHFTLRDQKFHISDLERQISVLNYHLDRYSRDTAATAAYVRQLEQENQALRTQADDTAIRTRALEQELCDLRAFAGDKEAHASELERQLQQLRLFTEEKEAYIRQLEQDARSLRCFAEEKDGYARQLERDLQSLRGFAREKEDYIRQLEGQVSDLNSFAEGKDRYARELEEQIAGLNSFAEGKDRYIRELEEQIAGLNAYAQGKCSYIEELEAQAEQLLARQAAHLELAEAHEQLVRTHELLLQRVRRLPFGEKLLKDFT